MAHERENQEQYTEAWRGDDRPFVRRPAPLPFQFQIPLGGGPAGIAVPFGGYGSPFAFTLPLGGAAPVPVPVPVPVIPVTAASAGRREDPPVTVAAMDSRLYVPPGEAEAETEAESAAIGEWVLSHAEAAGGDSRESPAAWFLANLWHDWIGPRAAHALGAFGSRERAPSANALFNALVYPQSSRQRTAQHRLCSELFRVLAFPGQSMPALSVRRGDVLLRAARGEGWGSIGVVGSPGLHSDQRLLELGLRGEGHPRIDVGQYVHVIDLGARVRPLNAAFARRLSDRTGRVLPNTLLLRSHARRADVPRARLYSFYDGAPPTVFPGQESFGGYSEQEPRQPAACTCATGSLFHYAVAFKTVATLIGARASIKTRYGKLCCEGTATTDAHSVTYVNISMAGSPLRWAQTGYGRARDPGKRQVANDHYLEIRGSATEYFIERNPAAPADGSTHTYQLTLDKATGKWTAAYDTTSRWCEHVSPGWRNQTGATVQFTGEILNEDDDMSGTDGDKCEFRGCAYQRDGASFTDAALTSAEVRSDDSARWGVQRLSGTSFCIWDKAPNP